MLEKEFETVFKSKTIMEIVAENIAYRKYATDRKQQLFEICCFVENRSNMYANSCSMLKGKIANGNTPTEYYMLHDIHIIFNKIVETFDFRNMIYFDKFTKELAILDELRRINNEE